MKTLYKFMMVGAVALMTSCVEDEGNNVIITDENLSTLVNTVTIEGLDDSFNLISGVEYLETSVDVEGSLSGKDDSQFDYEWYVCEGSLSDSGHKHTMISNEKSVKWLVNLSPGTYKVYFRARDKKTQMVWEKSTNLTVSTPITRGFYLFGDKEDGTCGLDFISILAGRDTAVVEDILKEEVVMHGAKDIVFSGSRYAGHASTCLWAVADDVSYPLVFTADSTKVGINERLLLNDIMFPSLNVKRPFKFVDMYPHPASTANTTFMSYARILLTEDGIFAGNMMQTEMYGNPFNRYSLSETTLFKPSKYVFYTCNAYSVNYLCFFDETNKRFVRGNQSSLMMYAFGTPYCATYTETAGDFYIDQMQYDSPRDLIYGENGYGNQGRSYALMKDQDGKYYIYAFRIASYAATGFSKMMGRDVTDVATDFNKASHYAFYSMQPILLYSVGSKLYGYNYSTNTCKMLKDFGAEITYLAMDYASGGNVDDVIVATYNASEKGTIRKFAMADDPNDIAMSEKQYANKNYPWKTKLKVAKVEYRNCSY